MPKHPHRYPKHDSNKGAEFLGECNTTRCTNGTAVYFNTHTYGYYCRVCAQGINYFERIRPLCIEVEASLTIEQMDDLHRADNQARYARP